MPAALIGRTRIVYETHGQGEPVVLVSAAASDARVWRAYQVPALTAAGYRVVAFNSRGMPPSDAPPGPYRLDQLVEDAAGLISQLGIGPCRLAGASLGALVVQELALARPELVSAAAMLGTRGRTDPLSEALAAGTAELLRSQARLPARFLAATAATQLLSPRTLGSGRAAADWLDVLGAFPVRGDGPAAQYDATLIPNRLAALGGIRCPCLVVAFRDDLVTPAVLCREVAEVIPGCRYVEVPGCGHLGYLERPDRVNRLLVDFFGSVGPAGRPDRGLGRTG